MQAAMLNQVPASVLSAITPARCAHVLSASLKMRHASGNPVLKEVPILRSWYLTKACWELQFLPGDPSIKGIANPKCYGSSGHAFVLWACFALFRAAAQHS